MENNQLEQRSRTTGLGPAPAGPRGAPPLSSSRAALLETLRAQTEPVTLAAITHVTGLHENTVREHLDALVEAGLASRSTAPPSGRGRPAGLYQATDPGPGASPEYAGLAAALARAIHHRSPTPEEDAVVAGRDWGRDLARGRGGRRPGAAAARREVVALLDDLGFAPETDTRASSVRLTRCPLLEAAHRYPDVVCGVHLGLTQAALEEYGAPADGVRLLPFAEPGACRLHLAARRR